MNWDTLKEVCWLYKALKLNCETKNWVVETPPTVKPFLTTALVSAYILCKVLHIWNICNVNEKDHTISIGETTGIIVVKMVQVV